MDSVRFGRALGFGARAAAKTLVTAVDAATSPNPSAKSPGSGSGSSDQPISNTTPVESRARASAARVGQQAAQTTAKVRQTRQGLKQGSKRFGEAMWGPFVKLSGVLWLEVTGLFFGVFAMFAAGGVWKLRGDLRDTGLNHAGHVHLLLSLVMAAVFGYFCVSSFVMASRRGRRS
jgi:hypothetical protein